MKNFKIMFTPEAYVKMWALVFNYNHEVCWYGLVDREDDEVFVIEDILVHPQNVTSASVRIDDESILEWTMNIPDETYNKMKFSGHSHVNMDVFRSSQDEETESSHAQQLPNGGYYIFAVVNQKLEYSFRLYIKEENELKIYEDVNIGIKTKEENLDEFLEEADKNINNKSKYEQLVFDYWEGEFENEFSEE